METYYLTDSQKELDRLAFQYQVWAKETSDLWNRANFTIGNHILDLGCGPGYATINLSQLVGEKGHVTAVDSSERFIKYLNKKLKASEIRNVTSHIKDINRLDFPKGSFHGIYSRMVMCFLADPRSILENLVEMLKPGGKIVITDFFSYSQSFYIVPHSQPIQKAMEVIENGNTQNGGNFNIQKEIPSILSDLGLKIVDTKAYLRTANSKEPLWYWPESYFENMLPKMADSNLLSKNDIESFWSDWNERKENSNSFFVGPILLDIIAEKP